MSILEWNIPSNASNKLVFLVGAGFSTEYGPPVMRAFMDVARQNYFNIKDQPDLKFLALAYDFLLQFQQQCKQGSGWICNRDWENIEEVYTQADLLRLAKIGQPLTAETLCTAIAWSIWDVYRKCSKLTSSSNVNSWLRDILNTIVETGLKPVLITTNYDLFVENSLTLSFLPHGEKRWIYYYPGFTWPRKTVGYLLPSPREPIRPERYALPIIKLHGSANWFDCGSDRWVATLATGSQIGEIASVDDPSSGPDQLQRQLAAEIKRVPLWEGVTSDNYGNIVAPAIIPPMLGKASVSDVISSQWRAAIEALAAARQLWIIGYSFPETDAFMPRLLSQGLQANRTLESIVIVNREKKTAWDARIRRLFTSSVTDTKVKYVALPTGKALACMGSNEMKEWIRELHEVSAGHSPIS